ncbi:MAG: hypothetical protein FK733_10640 [Asgard group archaeon]|nr:hypothetical protein [Asgard group archaeon]
MSKSRPFLGALLGAVIGVGLLVLFFWLGNIQTWFTYLSPVGWLIGGFIAGIIAKGPGKGALAGFLTAIIAFVLNSIVIVLLTVVTGGALFTVIFELATFGLFDPSTLSPLIGILIAIGLLISLVISLILGVVSIIAGLIGGAINNPNRSQADAYQEYPEEDTTYR